MNSSQFLLAAAAAIAIAAPASAQNFSLSPAYGTVNLRAGFTPDPHRTSLRSGGSNDASRLGGNCRGYVADAPDVRLNYDAGSLPLIIRALSNSDTTLVVNGPDGSWYCDDDGGEGLNPQLAFNSPRSGQYDIWVGTYGSASTEVAELQISELASGGSVGAVSGNRPDVSLPPSYETVNLRSGFPDDPYYVRLESGGNIDASTLGGNCRGYIAAAPDVRLNFDAATLPLIISNASESDTTLVINGPNGQWYCDDDSGNGSLNPLIRFDPPMDGQYDIWVGTYGSASLAPSRLSISEIYGE